MNIVALQAASGSDIEGPNIRVPIGNYKIEKRGDYKNCVMIINGSKPLDVNSSLILSSNSSIKLLVKEAKDLTIRFIKEI